MTEFGGATSGGIPGRAGIPPQGRGLQELCCCGGPARHGVDILTSTNSWQRWCRRRSQKVPTAAEIEESLVHHGRPVVNMPGGGVAEQQPTKMAGICPRTPARP